MTDYFVDSGSVLENKLGIKDQKKLQEIEQDIVTKKTATLLNKAETVFDFNFLLYIHKTIFEDIYDFAGKVRTVDIAKHEASTPFAYAKFINAEAKRIFDELKSKEYLTNLTTQLFIQEIANISAELNALHPFRDGNGRTIRLFLILLADSAGYLIDYSRTSSKEIINADKLAFEGNPRPLLALYKKITIEVL